MACQRVSECFDNDLLCGFVSPGNKLEVLPYDGREVLQNFILMPIKKEVSNFPIIYISHRGCCLHHHMVLYVQCTER